MQTIILDVSKKEGGKYVKQGEIGVVVPVVEDYVSKLVEAKVSGKSDDGMPEYDNDIANFVQNAVFAYVKAGARNKLVAGTAELRPGCKIPTNWEEFTAEGGGSGAALAILHELRGKFAEHVKTLGKSEAAQKVLTQYFNNKTALELATAENKAKMKDYIEAFAAGLEEADLEKFSRQLDSIMEICSSETLDF